MLKNLVIARHGCYDDDERDGRLHPGGKKQMQDLAEKLRKVIQDTPVILSSTAKRAIESAEIIAELFQTQFEKHDILWSDKRHPTDIKGTLDLIKKHTDQQTIIIVTHLEYTEELPYHFGKQELQCDFSDCDEISKGEAIHIKCGDKSISYIKP